MDWMLSSLIIRNPNEWRVASKMFYMIPSRERFFRLNYHGSQYEPIQGRPYHRRRLRYRRRLGAVGYRLIDLLTGHIKREVSGPRRHLKFEEGR